MNTNAQKLVDALRSGQYTQTKGRLGITKAPENNPDTKVGMCCLGVACEVAIANGLPLTRAEVTAFDKSGFPCTVVQYDGESAILPDTVRAWLGFNSRHGDHYMSAGEPVTLPMLNDQDGKSFEEIADRIASNPRGLFEAGKHL